MTKKLIQRSKFLSLLLRHQPEIIALDLDEQGWAAIEELIKKSVLSGQSFTKAQLRAIVEQDEKQRYAFNPNQSKIRANQGQSLFLKLELEQVVPPALLYHVTAQRFLSSMKATGLERQNRHHVHLSSDYAPAIQVGKRHGKPCVLAINVVAMHEDEYCFWRSANGVWFCNSVPPAYLSFPE